jgi:surfeit locus 1 family protein
MRFGEYHFRPRLIPTLVLALPIPLFVALGFWQLDRAAEKRLEAETLARREGMPPARVTGLETDEAGLRYRKVRARGEFDAERQFFIENRREGQRTGFHVITPLRLEGSEARVLVNRGWLPAGPGNDLPDAPVPPGTVELSGTATLAAPPALVLHAGPDAARAWGSRWPYLTPELYAATVDHPVQPFVILLDPEDPHGFSRHWPREMPKEGMHLGYAIQWFSFAAIALGFYVTLGLHRQEATA